MDSDLPPVLADIIGRTSLELDGDDRTELSACLVAAYSAGQRVLHAATATGGHSATVTSTDDGYVTIVLPGGRVVDVFPSGNVQVYSPDRTQGYEIALPAEFGRAHDPIPARCLG